MNGTEKVDRAAIRLAAIRARLDAEVDGYRNLQTRADTRALLAEVERFSRANETLTETAYSNVSVSGRVLPWSEIAEWQDRRIKTLTETVRRVAERHQPSPYWQGITVDGQMLMEAGAVLKATQAMQENVGCSCGVRSYPCPDASELRAALDGGVETDGAGRQA